MVVRCEDWLLICGAVSAATAPMSIAVFPKVIRTLLAYFDFDPRRALSAFKRRRVLLRIAALEEKTNVTCMPNHADRSVDFACGPDARSSAARQRSCASQRAAVNAGTAREEFSHNT